MNKYTVLIALLIVCHSACKENNLHSAAASIQDQLFDLKDNKAIGINFSNDLKYDKDFNVYKYRNFYNGGGVALGDINNDGLIDVYMVANQDKNRLYLNKGNWHFEDITDKSGVAGTKAWSTGVTMVDINGDGLLDIYVCNSGDVKGDNKENELFINKGNLTFEEKAADYGLNDKGYSTHASFFDFDKDGDLDCYILNNSFRAIGSFDLKKDLRNVRDPLGGHKFMENRNGKFVDISAKAGVYGSEIGFGLGITSGDINNDGWMDLYISNDFFERDYLYINQKNGQFKEDLVNQMPATSAASMGADMADINNDGWNEVFVTEMLPSDYQRLKTVTTFDDWNRYRAGVENGYHHQFTRNTLQLNNKNNTFSEVSRLAGVEASDWSWGALLFDMDNDGFKDLFIANGIYKDLTNQDYLVYISSDSVMRSIVSDKGVDYKRLIDIIPSNKVANHSYKNNGKLHFSKYTNSGLNTPGFSNGSAYGDLDNDGDLDLIVNNVNMPCFVYENKTNTSLKNNYIKLILKGSENNKYAIGAKVHVKAGDADIYQDNQPIRGFQSTMDNRLNIGIGKAQAIDITVTWPSGKTTNIKNQKVNQTLTIEEASAEHEITTHDEGPVHLTPFNAISYAHKDLQFNDFNRENLLYHMNSTRGPCASFGDVDGDTNTDIVIPGSKGSITTIYNNKNGSYQPSNQKSFDKKIDAEEIKCELFDADGDLDLDLYVVSGGNEISEYSELLYDELYINDGKGNFTTSPQKLPSTDAKISTGAVDHGDIDGDGDADLLVGERLKIDRYGELCSAFILVNDGHGIFTDKTSTLCPQLKNIGMITDVKIVDLDGDKRQDLIVTGEFMQTMFYKNTGKGFESVKNQSAPFGWWNAIETVDLDKDGDLDIIAANHGLNSRFKATSDLPITLFYSDFDNNNFPEGILANRHQDGKDYPYPLRHSLMARLPSFKKKFPDFASFKNADMIQIFGKDIIANVQKSTVNELRSMVLINNGNFSFDAKPLPQSVQTSVMYAIAAADLNADGYVDLIMGGNLYNVQPEMGRYDASYGHILINDGKGNFTDKSLDYGFSIKGEIRDIHIQDKTIFIFRNNDSVLTYKIN